MLGSSQADMVESKALAVYQSVLEDEEKTIARLELLNEHIGAQITASKARHAQVAYMLDQIRAALEEPV